jgi:hypothetical protein
MTEFAPYQKLEVASSEIFADLSKTWPSADIAYLRDIVAHAEYGDALENLIALGVAKATAFGPGLMRRLEGIGSAMGVDTAAVLKTTLARPQSSASNAAA